MDALKIVGPFPWVIAHLDNRRVHRVAVNGGPRREWQEKLEGKKLEGAAKIALENGGEIKPLYFDEGGG